MECTNVATCASSKGSSKSWLERSLVTPLSFKLCGPPAESSDMPTDRNVQATVSAASTALSMFDLRVQVGPDGPALLPEHEALGAHWFAEGVVRYLVVRTETGIRPISVAEIERLGWSVEDAWSSAWAMTCTMERPSEINVVDTGQALLFHLYSEHDFGASFVPFLDDVLAASEPLGEHGAIVSMPMRRSVFVHPIRGGEVISAVQAMIPITRQIYQTGADAVSAQLYWWQAGQLTWIPTYYGRDAIEFYPPTELSDAIDAIDDVI